jgi:hypothetical protein
MTYDDVKNKFEELRPRLIIIFCCAVMFAAGFGAGRFDQRLEKPVPRVQSNYTKKTETERPISATSVKETPKTGECLIKGNISGSKKTYHMPGGSFYDRTNAEMCFATESEAEAAGFTKSSR